MSAVSAESPESAADISAQPNGRSSAPETTPPAAAESNAVSTDFGPNEWLVDELYQRYLADPGSVDRAWWNFFADYHPKPPDQPRVAAPPPAAPPAASPAPRPAPATGPAPPRPRASGRARHLRPRLRHLRPRLRHLRPRLRRLRLRARRLRPRARHPRPGCAATPASPPPSAAPGRPGAPARPGPAPATSGPAPSRAAPAAPAADAASANHATDVRLRGAAARTAANMAASLTVPTATSVRAVPAKLLVDNRIVINNHLGRGRGGKVSFTHLIGYAVVKALASAAGDERLLRRGRRQARAGQAGARQPRPGHRRAQGRRVPAAAGAQHQGRREPWTSASSGWPTRTWSARPAPASSTVEDFAGTTISLTNPGTIGTEHSVPRLMPGQGCIVGVGAMEYPAAYQGASPETLARLAISKTVTLTSTYDHRIIQGAQSGEFLRIDPPAAARRARASTTRSSSRCGSPTSRSAGCGTSRPATRTTSPRPPGCTS